MELQQVKEVEINHSLLSRLEALKKYLESKNTTLKELLEEEEE